VRFEEKGDTRKKEGGNCTRSVLLLILSRKGTKGSETLAATKNQSDMRNKESKRGVWPGKPTNQRSLPFLKRGKDGSARGGGKGRRGGTGRQESLKR